ncbi:MAG: DUF2029 domain-containing protein, partial [Elusimicrobia bacterium]|nr:DUF2029 domain-containing protein [Elusimicrobiota bacterium]
FGKAFMLFQLLSHAAIWGFWAVWVRGLPVDGRAEKALVGFAVLFLFYPLHLSLQLGQSEPFILLALAVALRSLRGDRPLVAGLCLAAAIWLKLFLALLLLHLLLRRQYRALGSCAAWLAVLFAAGCCVVPWDVQAAYWKRLGQPLGLEAFYDNQSVGGFAYRAFALTPYSAWLDLPGLARGLKGALSLALLAGYARAAWRARGADHDARLLALCLVTGLLVSPHSDTHHQALLLPAFLALPIDAAFLAFYAFFAEYLPIVAYKFISPSRLGWIIQGPLCAALSLPFLALAGLWLYLIRGLESDSSTKSR